MLTDQQVERYSRQIILPEVGGRGQERLLSASVAIVGAGGAGSTAAVYLAAAGIGSLTVIDAGAVQANDLNASVIHPTAHVGRNRAESVATAIATLNPDCRITPRSVPLTVAIAEQTARLHDVVIDANVSETDAAIWETSARLNAACVTFRKPLVWGHALECNGRAATFAGHQPDAPCFRCLQPHPPNSTSESTVMGVAAGFVGTLQATDTIKLLLGMDATITGRIVTYDILPGEVREAPVRKDPHCPTCGSSRDSAATTESTP